MRAGDSDVHGGEVTPDIRAAFDSARVRIRETAFDGFDSAEADEAVKRFNVALQEFEREAFFRGWELANHIEQREREEHVELLLQVAASLKGKDRADGIIKFEVYPDPDIYDRANVKRIESIT